MLFVFLLVEEVFNLSGDFFTVALLTEFHNC